MSDAARRPDTTAGAPLRIVSFTSLYPNAAQPGHGLFVEHRLRQLVRRGGVDVEVIAPVPWFPSSHRAFGSYARFAAAPRRERRHGLEIEHPRYPVLPKVGTTAAPWLMTLGCLASVRRALRRGADLIDAHYFYPDGVAAVALGQRLGKPVVVTARGSDLNVLAQLAGPRRAIRWAAGRAAALITVSAALKRELVALGVPDDKITVLRNGVDLELFRPLDRAAARRELDLERRDGRVLLSVGNLVPLKGHDLVIRALQRDPHSMLVIAGEGVERERLGRLADDLDVADRVRFVGRVEQRRLPTYYSAADALILASSREGWPNVLLEAMACGTPAVASAVSGIPEVIRAPEAGVLMTTRSADGIAEALRRLFAATPSRAAVRGYAEQFSWDETSRGQLRLFRQIAARG